MSPYVTEKVEGLRHMNIRICQLLCFLLSIIALAGTSPRVFCQPAQPTGSELQAVVRVQSVSGKADELRALLQQLAKPTREEPGCRSYEFHESATTPGLFFLHERWADRPALARHLRSPHYIAAVQEVERLDLLAAPPEFVLDRDWRPIDELREEAAESAVSPIPGQSNLASDALLFAPGTISTGAYELNAAFTRDGRTLYFARSMPVFPFPNDFTTILVSQRRGEDWSEPRVAEFSGIYSDIDPYLSVDESSLFFMSNRPLAAGGPPRNDFDVWVVERVGAGWGEPRNLGAPVNTRWMEGYPAVAANGNLYFFSLRPGGHGPADIYRARRLHDGRYAEPENLGPSVNTAFAETNVYVAPDESYLIFSSSRLSDPSDPFARMDLYVSFRKEDGWSEAESLGEKVNTAGWEFTPMVTPDGKYLFFTRAVPRRDLRYRGARAISYRDFSALLNGPRNGLGDVFFVEMSALRPEWKPSGERAHGLK